jgi:ubiquinone/menaquinone biosynthesis C-methylase UbiE
VGFRLLYREMAWIYDAVAWLVSFGQWKAWGRTAIPLLVGEDILELGHGPGHLMKTLYENGLRPVGLDASPQMVRIARRRLRRAGLPAPVLRGEAQCLPFPAEAFESVVATFPTAYIVELCTLREIARVLRPGGRLVVVMGSSLTGDDPLTRFVEWLYRITGQRPAGDGADRGWLITAFSRAGLWAQLTEVEMDRSQVHLIIVEHLPANAERDSHPEVAD